MKKLVYVKKREADNSFIYCVHKEYETCVKELFKDYKYKIVIDNFDCENIGIYNNSFNVPNREFWYDVLNILKDNGFEFSSYVENKYQYYQNELKKIEEEKILAKEKAELERQEREVQEKERLEKISQQESEYGLLCNKYGCLTNIGFCINKCKYNTVYNMNCRPERVKIKKEGI